MLNLINLYDIRNSANLQKVFEILDTVISAGGLIPVVKHTNFSSTRVVSYTIKPGETHCKIISGDHPVSRDRSSNKSTKPVNGVSKVLRVGLVVSGKR